MCEDVGPQEIEVQMQISGVSLYWASSRALEHKKDRNIVLHCSVGDEQRLVCNIMPILACTVLGSALPDFGRLCDKMPFSHLVFHTSGPIVADLPFVAPIAWTGATSWIVHLLCGHRPGTLEDSFEKLGSSSQLVLKLPFGGFVPSSSAYQQWPAASMTQRKPRSPCQRLRFDRSGMQPTSRSPPGFASLRSVFVRLICSQTSRSPRMQSWPLSQSSIGGDGPCGTGAGQIMAKTGIASAWNKARNHVTNTDTLRVRLQDDPRRILK